MRRHLIAAAFSLAVLGSVAAAQPDAAKEPVTGPYLLADAETGQVLADADALRPWYPASTTKLMTLYVAFRAVLAGELTLQSPVTFSAHAAAQPPSKMGFKPGTVLSLADAIRIMMVKSANDVAVAVAETVGGSEAAFAERMNRAAAALGMTRSHFVNPHGLPDERQVTAARDMALLARALLVEFPQHRDFYRIHAIQVGDKVMKNFNTLIERYAGANGMKTGFICASGYNLVASARRDGRELIAVVFGGSSGKQRAERAAGLLDEGFAAEAPEAGPTLATVSSGAAYTAPIDMRPFICGGEGDETAAENADPAPKEGRPVATAAAVPASPLGPPLYFGPPIRIVVMQPSPQARPGDVGFLARIPRPRPAAPGEVRGIEAGAFAPTDSARETLAAPVGAIGSAAGEPAPLPDLLAE